MDSEVEELLSVRGRFDAPLPPRTRRRFGLAMGRAGSVRVAARRVCEMGYGRKPGKTVAALLACGPELYPIATRPPAIVAAGAVESS